MMKAIETTGIVNAQGQISLDKPLMIESDRRVRIIVLISDESEIDPDDDPIETVREGIRQGWHEAMIGQTYPISQLWDGIDVD
jgi:hypothetical protein